MHRWYHQALVIVEEDLRGHVILFAYHEGLVIPEEELGPLRSSSGTTTPS